MSDLIKVIHTDKMDLVTSYFAIVCEKGVKLKIEYATYSIFAIPPMQLIYDLTYSISPGGSIKPKIELLTYSIFANPYRQLIYDLTYSISPDTAPN